MKETNRNRNRKGKYKDDFKILESTIAIGGTILFQA